MGENKEFYKTEFLRNLLLFANASFHQEVFELVSEKDISSDESKKFLNDFLKAITDFNEKFHSGEVELETLPQVMKLLNEFNRDYLKIVRTVDKLPPRQKDETVEFLDTLFKKLGFKRVGIVKVNNK